MGMRVQRSKRFALNFNNGSKPFGSQQLQKSLFFHFSLFLNLLDGVANLIDGWNGGAGTTNHSVIDHFEGATFNKFASASGPACRAHWRPSPGGREFPKSAHASPDFRLVKGRWSDNQGGV
ncbi:hypothetical protein ALQ60_102194 [Pseudomonas syringae pv. papulans]|nr:hypothetical protein ALO65_102316 [Pseudomonas syringae pv. papulans]RMN47060.1 hypothetical protein ALQ60_102194 [Pseudomonas syringae pv. papulans]RMN60798.1 hypothetical protein ALQ56_103028 [Pseudomonas syringae pv. papulans]RMV52698.1 hypothetical protein ALP11_102677 [Pseudomonas syringae pv. papulans]